MPRNGFPSSITVPFSTESPSGDSRTGSAPLRTTRLINKGMANAKLKNLDPVMQKHFNYDAAKAEAAAKSKELGSIKQRK